MYKQSLFLSISKGLKSISTLVITMIIARVLSQDDYGIYRQFILVSTIMVGFLTFGIPTAVSYLFKTLEKKDISKLFNTTTLILGFINALAILLLIILKTEFVEAFSKNGEIANYFYILIFYTSIQVMFSFLENIFTSDNKGHIFAKYNILYFIIQIPLFSIVSLLYKDIYILLLLLSLLEFIKGLFLYVYYYKLTSLKVKFDLNLMQHELKVAYPIGLSFIAQTVNQYLGNLFVSKNYSIQEFALFSVGVTEIPLISIITVSIATTVLPTLSKKYNVDNDIAGMLVVWRESTLFGALFIFPVFWVLLFFGKGYLEFIFSANFLQAINIYNIFLLKLPLAITIFGNILIVLNKSRYIIFNMIIAIFLNFLFIVIFNNYYSLEGIALASVLTQFLLVIITLFQIKKVLGTSFKMLLPFKKIGILFSISGITVSIGYLISKIFTVGNITAILLFGGISFLLVNLIFYSLGYYKNFTSEIKSKIRS